MSPRVILLFALAAACGETTPPSVTPTAPAPAPPAAPIASAAPAAPPAPPVQLPASWSKDLTKEQQMAFMKQKVVPAMAPVFKGHDAQRYASFDCTTCHGPEYKDPHDYLPKLGLKGGKMTAFTDHPEMSKFMAEEVTPKMAAAMGLPPYDRTTHQGFGCNGCHATVELK